ncbi:lipopolysaccharide biosynthesis protein [Winogradskyella bathintestinalis]|uniref:Lipopolysaccharide biosynthesis protein n=1 Tax=Winogradskyella bathintestinalis TaxID=3035208 RepID=A0ABT7ZSS2_9FLAO|nr:lipopolysaccharide biosynthesis protein [Winogradskyella bathintestinalis]MDN3492045.1 lipopolysaccharide biosynthesis protein [Winogradskyella bathintestinalis]
MSLKEKTISGIFWSFLQQVGGKGLGFVVTIILARLLTPEAFGLIGMLVIFIQVSEVIVQGGFNLALIQKKEIDDLDYSSVFWINLITSLALYIIIFFGAPYIASFYGHPILEQLVRVLSLVFVINSFSIVQETKLRKELNFKTLMLVHLPSTIIGGIMAIFMAYRGYGVWSLVALQVMNRLLYTIQIWIHARWKPQIIFRWDRIKILFDFGWKIFLSGIIGRVYNNTFQIIIGKFYPAASLGYYQNSITFVRKPSETLSAVLRNVTFPAFSTIQSDHKRLKSGYKKIMQQTFFWLCPVFVFAAVLAVPLFDVVLGSKWLPAVPYFRWLCIIGIINPLSKYNLEILNVKGRSDLFLKVQLVERIITVLAVLAVFKFSITALLVVMAANSLLRYGLFSYFSGRLIDYPSSEQFKHILPTFLISIAVGIGIACLDKLIADNFTSFIRILVGGICATGSYWLLSHLFKIAPYQEIVIIFNSKISHKIRLKK